MVYTNDTSTYDELLLMDGSINVHYRNIQTLAIEMYKSKYNLSTDILNNLFSENIYTGPALRSHLEFNLPRVNTVHYGHDSLRYLGAKIWSLVPEQIKSVQTVLQFKTMIKSWIPDQCPCRLCKQYVHGLGYVNVS